MSALFTAMRWVAMQTFQEPQYVSSVLRDGNVVIVHLEAFRRERVLPRVILVPNQVVPLLALRDFCLSLTFVLVWVNDVVVEEVLAVLLGELSACELGDLGKSDFDFFDSERVDCLV